MKRKLSKQFSAYLSLLILLLGQFWGLSSVKTFADTVDSKRYIGWTITTGETPASFDESIYVSPQGSHAGDLADAIVAYCFNYTYATPPKSDSTTNYPIYEKETGTAESFGQYATSKRITNEELYKAVLKVMYNGFPNNAASLQGAISDARFRAVTQYAVWHFTDNYDATTILSSDELELYNTLIGNKAGAKNVPEDATLDIYRNTMEVHASTAQGASKPEYQNLLSSRFVNKVTGEELKITPSIDIYAKKVWENANSIVKKPDVSFRLKNKATDAQVGEILTVSTSESTEESNVVKWENIPGKHSDYIVEEVSVPEGYTSSGRGSGKGTLENPFVITNKKQSDIPAYVQSISVTKVWKGEKADTSKRPDVYFTIFQVKNGIETILTADKLPTPKGFENPKKLTSLAPVTWRNLYAPGIDKDTNEPISYIVKETDKDGNVLTSPNYEVSSTVIGANTANHSYTFTNTFKEEKTNSKEIEISKVNLGGEELEGAKIRISKDGKEVESWTSTKTAKSLKLEAGEYVFHEISAPARYKVVTDITFTVDKDGNVTVTNDTTTGTKTVVAGNKLVITDETTAHDVLFSKTDLGGSEIAGARIEIRDTENNLVTSWTSEAGVTKQVSLNEGAYTFNEVVAPAGFVKVTAITFTVSTDGQVYVVHSDQNKVTSSKNHLTVIDDAVAKPIETPKGSLTVQKVDATSNAVLQGAVFSVVGNITETTSTVDSSKVDATLAAKQEEIAQLQAKLAELEETAKATDPADSVAVEANRLAIENAQKALDAANNSYSALLIEKTNLKPTVTSKTVTKDFGTVTTDANGVASLTELPDGEYSITETKAPAGYDLDSKPHVVTIKDGQASVTSNTLVVTNSKTVIPTPQFDITIRKVDLAGSELAGAQIQVKQGDTVISEWTSTGQGQVVSLKPGTYTFHEVAAPNGYKVVTDITFSVDETGQVAILSARADEAKVAANELIVTDQKVQQPQETQPQTPKTNNNKFKGDDTSKGSSSATEVVGNSESNKVLPATNSTDLKGVVIAGFGFLIAGFVLAFFGKKKKA